MDLNTRARKETNEEIVREYAELMEGGVTFPPCSVFFDVATQQYIMADGFHRLLAHLKAKPNDAIEVEQYLGNAADALWFAIGANKSHGLWRTNEDKHNAVKMALLHENGFGKSNTSIAVHVGVHEKTVRNIRQELESSGEIPVSDTRTGADGRTYNVANIGNTTTKADICGVCRHYKRGGCLLDGEEYPSDNSACKNFGLPPKPVPARDEGVDVVCKYDPNEQREVKHRVSRRHKGDYVRVPLDKTNTDRAAVEIRMFLGENYLASLTQSALKILNDED